MNAGGKLRIEFRSLLLGGEWEVSVIDEYHSYTLSTLGRVLLAAASMVVTKGFILSLRIIVAAVEQKNHSCHRHWFH